MKLRILEASGATGDCAYKLIRTAVAITDYLAALKNSADIDDKTGEVVRDGLPKYYEGFTREDFIDPLLSALGWDVSRKRHVRIERRIDYDRVADYVLRHSGGEAFAVVEAKKVSEGLEKHEPQLFQLHARRLSKDGYPDKRLPLEDIQSLGRSHGHTGL